jgi:hypothetical protein
VAHCNARLSVHDARSSNVSGGRGRRTNKAADRAATCRPAVLPECQGMLAGAVVAPEVAAVTAAVRIHVRQVVDAVVDVSRSCRLKTRASGRSSSETASMSG